MDTYPKAFFQGEITDIENANVSIMTHALQYGTGFFAGLRAYYSEDDQTHYLFRPHDHYERFLSSAKIMGLTLPYSRDELVNITKELLVANQPSGNVYIRPFGYIGATKLSPSFSGIEQLDFALYMLPLDDYLPTDKGLNVGVSSWQRISDLAIPSRAKISGGYINSALATNEAIANGFDEAIMLRPDGRVAEGAVENLFIVRNGTLITPGVNEGILEGITRRTILELAADLGIPVETRPIERSELYIADEIFLSGTGCQIAWVASVDHRSIGDGTRGPVTEKLQDLYFRVVRGQETSYAKWCTKVSAKQ